MRKNKWFSDEYFPRSARGSYRPGVTWQCKQKILKAVESLLNEVGGPQLSVKRIAQRAGVSQATIYAHWGNLDALVAELVDERHVPSNEPTPKPPKSPRPQAKKALAEPIPEGSRFRVFATIPGGLTEDDKDRICDLAEAGVKSWTIARQIKRHPSTVAWFMWGMGLKKMGTDKKGIYFRNGVAVVPFSQEEDEFILARRIIGDTPASISQQMRERFPHPRSRDTVASRLLMHASDEAAREDEASREAA